MGLPSDLQLLDNLGSTTMDQIFGEMTDQFFPTNALVLRLLQLEKARGGGAGKFVKERGAGIAIRETIIYNSIPGDSYDDATTFDASEHEFMTQFRFPWKHCYVPINFNAIKVAQNAGNNEVQFFDLVEATAENAYNSLLDMFGYKIYGTTKSAAGVVSATASIPARDPDGLYNALDTNIAGTATYTTYGGITRAASTAAAGDPGFAANSNIIDAGGAPLTLPLLQQGYSLCVFNRSHPDVGISDRAIWNQIWERVQAQDRNPPGPLREAGFETIRFNGAEVIPDDHALPQTFYWLTAEAWRLWILEGRDMVRRASKYNMPGGFPLPTQDRTVDQLVLSANLICPGPRFQCQIRNIAE